MNIDRYTNFSTLSPTTRAGHSFSDVNISDSFKCCIEKILHDVDINDFGSLYELKNLFQPCQQYHTNKQTSILTPVFAFFTSPNKSFEEKICRQAYCEHSPNSWNTFYIVVLVLTLMIAIIGNITVCIVVVKDRPVRRRATNVFLLSLAVSDFFCSVSMLPVKISTALTNGNFCSGLDICKLYHTADHMFFAASVTHLFVVCIDRYLAIDKPYQYVVLFNQQRRKRILFLIWFYSILWAIITSFNKDSMGFDGTYYIAVFRCKFRNTTVINVMYLLVFFLPCMVMAALYSKIWWIAVTQATIIRKQHERYHNNPRCSLTVDAKHTILNPKKHLTSRKLELKATKMILTVFGTFLVCWSPVISMVTVNSFKKIEISMTVYKIFCEFLPNLNSALNPFIYCLMHKDFRQGLKHIIHKMTSQTRTFKKPNGSSREHSKAFRSSFSCESATSINRIEKGTLCNHRNSTSL